MKQQKPAKHSRPDPNAKNEPAKRVPTGGRDDVRQSGEARDGKAAEAGARGAEPTG